jgi:hypothetical protein
MKNKKNLKALKKIDQELMVLECRKVEIEKEMSFLPKERDCIIKKITSLRSEYTEIRDSLYRRGGKRSAHDFTQWDNCGFCGKCLVDDREESFYLERIKAGGEWDHHREFPLSDDRFCSLECLAKAIKSLEVKP